ncbi:MAG: tetratricopeptide repeat protein [Bacteroidales bacterium]|nr:tetratricopeptide repeat protein [Bacteroidales bacterium]
MRKLLLIIAFCCLTCMGSAQKTVTMKGTVRKITYPDTKGNTLVPLQGVRVKVNTEVSSDAAGRWQVPVVKTSDGFFRFTSIMKEGYQLVSPQLNEPQLLDAHNDVVIILENKEEKAAHSTAYVRNMRKQYRRMIAQYEDQLDSLKTVLGAAYAENERYQAMEREYRQFSQDYYESNSRIEAEAERLASIDYQSLDSVARLRLRLKTEGNWEELQKIIVIPDNVEQLAAEYNANKLQRQEQQAREDAVAAHLMEDLKDKADVYKMLVQHDSAALCLKNRMGFHPDSIGLIRDYADYLTDFAAHYAEALALEQRILALQQSRQEHEDIEEASTYFILGNIYDKLGKYDSSASMYEKALVLQRKAYGEESADVAMTYASLSPVYYSLGSHEKAMAQAFKALKIGEKLMGAEDYRMTTIYNNLGFLYSNQGEYDKAQEMYQKSLAIALKNVGEEHPIVAVTYSNIGLVYDKQGKETQSLEMYGKALALQQRMLGEGHPGVATVYNNMAAVYYNRGEMDKAIDIQQKALPIMVKALGENHPDVASLYSNISNLYREQGDQEHAYEMCQKALSIRQKTFGEESAEVALSYVDLGALSFNKDQYDEAQNYFDKAMKIQQVVLGGEHPQLAVTMVNMGLTHQMQGDTAQAIAFYQQAAAIEEKVQGEGNLVLADTYSLLASLYSSRRDYAMALKMHERRCRQLVTIYGEGSAEMVGEYVAMSQCQRRIGNYAKALKILQKGLTWVQKDAQQNQDSRTQEAVLRNHIALLHYSFEKYEEALKEYAVLLPLQQELKGERSMAVANVCYSMGSCYRRMGDHRRALEKSQQALDIVKGLEDADPKQVEKIQRRVTECLEALGNQDKE